MKIGILHEYELIDLLSSQKFALQCINLEIPKIFPKEISGVETCICTYLSSIPGKN